MNEVPLRKNRRSFVPLCLSRPPTAYGSGGFLYTVSCAVSKSHHNFIKSPNGMSHADILEAYPRVPCDECKGTGNSCCNGPCHKCNGDLVLRRSRLERI